MVRKTGMYTHRIILLTLASVCFLTRAIAADHVATFSGLPKGDELQMTFTTSGCFHYASYELTFRHPAETTVNIVQIEPEWSQNPSNHITLGELSLTKADVEGLDRLLQFYRSGPGKGCTTVDKISISQHHDGKITATEQFIDGSCSYDRKELTRITALVDKLTKKK